MSSWRDTFQFDVLPTHVAPTFPRLGDEVRLTVALTTPNGDAKLFVRWTVSGEPQHAPLIEVSRQRGRQMFTCDMVLKQTETRLHFLVADGSELTFFWRGGWSPTPPSVAQDFVILTDLDVPHWMYQGPMYHIVPDRFCRAHSNLEGLLSDGAIRMSWNDEPLSYERGKCRDFFLGNLAGVEQHIDHFQELGVRGVCMTPVFSALSTHRYDTIDYATVDPLLGGNAALARLSGSLHRQDIRLVLDIATNHTSAEHPWFRAARADANSLCRSMYFFDDRESYGYVGWADLPQYPKLDYSSPLTRERMFQSHDSPVQSLLREPYHIDGWRFDAAHQTGNHGRQQLGHEVFRDLRSVAKDARRDVCLIGECGSDASAHLQGDEWDAATNYWGSARPLRWFVGELDFFQRSFVVTGQPSRATTGAELARQLELAWTAVPTQLLLTQYNFIDCHDAPRFHNTPLATPGKLRTLLILLYLLPGVPVIYYGSEVGIRGGVTAPEDFRFPMPWQRDEWCSSLLELYSMLGRLRSEQVSLKTGSYRIVYADDEAIVLARYDGRRGYLGVASNATRTKTLLVHMSAIGLLKATPRVLAGTADVVLIANSISVCLAAGDATLLEMELEE